MTDPAPPRTPWWAATATPGLPGDWSCTICGTPVGDDADDEPDVSTGPMCGDCARARAFDQTLWEQDLAEPDAGLW